MEHNGGKKTFYFRAAISPHAWKSDDTERSVRIGGTLFLVGLVVAVGGYFGLSQIFRPSRALILGSIGAGFGAAWLLEYRMCVSRFRRAQAQQILCDVVVDDMGLSVFAGEHVQKHPWSEIKSVELTGSNIVFLKVNGSVDAFSVAAIGSSERMQAIWAFAQDMVRQKAQVPQVGSNSLQ